MLHVVVASETTVEVTPRRPLVVLAGTKREEKVRAPRRYADDARGPVSVAEEHLATNAESS